MEKHLQKHTNILIPDDLDAYEKNYIKKSDFITRFTKLMSLINNYFNPEEECKLIELGCRDGILGKFLKANNKNNIILYGIDIDKSFIGKAESNGYKCKICDLNFEQIPYDDNSFDCVIAFEIIEHIPFYHNILSETARILRDKGYLFLTTPNIAHLRNRFKLLLGKDIHRVYTKNQKDIHFRMFSIESINKLISLHNFDCIFANILTSSKSNRLKTIKKIFPNTRDIIFVVGQNNEKNSLSPIR